MTPEEGILQENKEKIVTSKLSSNLPQGIFIIGVLRTSLCNQKPIEIGQEGEVKRTMDILVWVGR